MLNSEEILALHRTLVETPSVSHHEADLMDWVAGFLSSKGAKVMRHGLNVVAIAGNGPRLLFNTHLDTVPVTASWTRAPHKASREEGKVFGLGSNDAKGCAAAMLAGFLQVLATGGPCELALMLVIEEETGGKGTEVCWPWLRDVLVWLPDGAVVGEPTQLQVGITQKGLLQAELVTRGQACHAANATAIGAKNPIWELAADLVALQSVDLGTDPELGPTTLQPTRLEGADARNQVPGEAVVCLDIRTNPDRNHDGVLRELQAAVKGEIRARSLRLEPYACPPDAAIVQAALAAREGSKTFGSRTMSDQVFFKGVPTIKCGPGDSARSHTSDEFIFEQEILDGAAFYSRLARKFAEVAR